MPKWDKTKPTLGACGLSLETGRGAAGKRLAFDGLRLVESARLNYLFRHEESAMVENSGPKKYVEIEERTHHRL
jgi:hypothetical protein